MAIVLPIRAPLVLSLHGHGFRGARPSWAPPAAAFAGDLLGNRYWRTARPTCVRASDGYAQTVGGVWVKFSPGELRLTDRGLLVPEPSRTEQISNNQMIGADVGNPGTLPASWITSQTSGTRQVVGVGTDHGLPCVDVRFLAPPGPIATTWWEVFQGYVAQPADGSVLYASAYLALVDQGIPFDLVTALELELNGGTVTAGGARIQYIALAPTLTRHTMAPVTITTRGATIRFMLRMNTGSNPNGRDFTIRIVAPSLSYTPIDSPIATTGTAPVTRAADTVSIAAPAGSYALHLVMDDASETVLPGWTPADPLPLELPQGKYITSYYGVAA